VAVEEPEFEEVIEEYDEEVLVQEEAPKPPVADFANTSPA
jgi:hypothetical protein